MRKECTIGVILERYDRDTYVKPFFYNLPYSPKVNEWSFDYHSFPKLVIDSKCFGIMFNFFFALSEPNETNIHLQIIITDDKEIHEGWIELERYMSYSTYEAHGLGNYKGECHGSDKGPTIDLTELYDITPPKYIYLKKI